MSRIVYLNGEFLDENEAKVSIFDRGFLMADGVYEVTSVINGKLIDFDGHAVRLERSMKELMMDPAISKENLLEVHRQLIVKNDLNEGMIYLQITRGSPNDRDFVFPDPKKVKPTIVLFTQSNSNMVQNPKAKIGMKVVSIPDERWGRRDIKTVQLLYPSMGKMIAKSQGADDAWMVEDGMVTEGTSNNAYIVKDDSIITRELSNDILHGITRAAVLRFANEAQMTVEERNFSIEEAKNADEAFITSASTFVMPVVNIDGVDVGTGKPGKIAARLREIYLEETLKTAI
ncbi:D-amino-acid transaminase [Amylibacter sp.]|nr:D-amino-acid transaminase [Amylibacter sp.]